MDRRADAYARNFAPIFVSKYMQYARSGQVHLIPAAVRGHFLGHGDANGAVYQILYNYRASTGQDYPLP